MAGISKTTLNSVINQKVEAEQKKVEEKIKDREAVAKKDKICSELIALNINIEKLSAQQKKLKKSFDALATKFSKKFDGIRAMVCGEYDEQGHKIDKLKISAQVQRLATDSYGDRNIVKGCGSDLAVKKAEELNKKITDLLVKAETLDNKELLKAIESFING